VSDVGSNSHGEEYCIDVKTVEFSDKQPGRLWLKTVSENESCTVDSYERLTANRLISSTSRIVYNSRNEVMTSSETTGGWERIVPESIRERLYSVTAAEELTAL
jgi:hypothetical protein